MHNVIQRGNNWENVFAEPEKLGYFIELLRKSVAIDDICKIDMGAGVFTK
ncbi:hypothetical protein DCCM_4203 [Desulfocucumis palustris]|uniref:Uncharacterized protein n=1 Tax=Desulfocucumis palustris TaxID=1898651 RepID=A0A2L2XG02_9FIRM|nr:hypothetical protein DCCM_4203 [Desulfocucumis palustris]